MSSVTVLGQSTQEVRLILCWREPPTWISAFLLVSLKPQKRQPSKKDTPKRSPKTGWLSFWIPFKTTEKGTVFGNSREVSSF